MGLIIRKEKANCNQLFFYSGRINQRLFLLFRSRFLFDPGPQGTKRVVPGSFPHLILNGVHGCGTHIVVSGGILCFSNAEFRAEKVVYGGGVEAPGEIQSYAQIALRIFLSSELPRQIGAFGIAVFAFTVHTADCIFRVLALQEGI